LITLTFQKEFPIPVEDLFAWHERPGAFLRLNPPFEPVELVSHSGGIRDGATVVIKVPVFGKIGIRWNLTHKGYIENKKFEDHQVNGPFKSWKHQHVFEGVSSHTSILKDELSFSLPFPILSEPLFGWIFRKKLERLFKYRHHITLQDLSVIEKYKGSFQTQQNFLISGASGFLGKSLVAFLLTAGHSVSILSRGNDEGIPDAVKRIPWNPYKKIISPDSLEGFDHIIHLSGESVAKRWSTLVKDTILRSRVETTSFLVECISKLKNKPKTFISASGSGFYGTDTKIEVDESSPQGEGFLADVVRQWEEASTPLNKIGIRVCHARFGIILSPDGGALKKLLLPFQLGIGGPIGKGQRFMSCISKDDVIYGLYHLAASQEVSGAFNFCLPKATTNLEFSRTLSTVLRRPCLFPVPPLFLRLVFGQMADETILSSQRIIPKKLLESNFAFTSPTLESAFRGMMGK
jgi:uncharacterized protein (TIGR01777 family)